MWTGTVITDFNGIVLFEPVLLRERYGGAIAEGTDLFTRYRTSDEGDAVLAAGLIVPVLAIDDAGYDAMIRLSSEPAYVPGQIVAENGIFPLRVKERLVIADLVVLKEWMDDLGWIDVPVSPGNYAVTVRA